VSCRPPEGARWGYGGEVRYGGVKLNAGSWVGDRFYMRRKSKKDGKFMWDHESMTDQAR
jgi:hypothetical protein